MHKLPRKFARLLPSLFTTVLLAMAPSIHAGMTNDVERLKEIAAWLPPKPRGLGPPISDREAWSKIASHPAFSNVVAQAAKAAGKPLPASPDDLFLEFSRNGNRTHWQDTAQLRRGRISTFVLAECIENQGRFLKPLEETLRALCTEQTWVMPAHDRALKNFKGETVEIDLGAAMLGWDIATADWLLGEKLTPATRSLIRENLERRIFAPFRDMVQGRTPEIFWLPATHNWNAVCLAGVIGAALAADDSAGDRALFVAAAQHYIRNFLSGFTPDGYCSEGIGYWSYGFGHFVLLTETVRQATRGKVDLLAEPGALPAALFAPRSEILNGVYPTIADCHPGSHPDSAVMRYVSERFGLDLPQYRSFDPAGPQRSLYVAALYSFLPNPLPPASHKTVDPRPGLRTWFNDGGVLICRPAPDSPVPFAACLKGGHNAEHHNHNDVGSFSVVVGNTMVLCDPGAEVYTARTFSGDRYKSKVLSSYGHAVPVLAGQLQRPGAAARAKVLRADFSDAEDTLALDYRSAYAVPELTRLERTFVFHRGSTPSLTVRDLASFNAAKPFETALVTWGETKQVSDHEWLVSDGDAVVRVKIETGGQPVKLTTETLNEDVPTPRKPVRLGFALQNPAKEFDVTLTITPVPGGGTARGK